MELHFLFIALLLFCKEHCKYTNRTSTVPAAAHATTALFTAGRLALFPGLSPTGAT
jgi:hypothetical protein